MKPILEAFESLFAALADQNLDMPTLIRLPPRTHDAFVVELDRLGFKTELRPGLFCEGHEPMRVPWQRPAIEIQTTSGVVRFERS